MRHVSNSLKIARWFGVPLFRSRRTWTTTTLSVLSQSFLSMSERHVSALIITVVALGLLWALRSVNEPTPKLVPTVVALVPDMVPL